MITKIGFELTKKCNNKVVNNSKNTESENCGSNSVKMPLAKSNISYFVPFTAKSNENTKYNKIKFDMDSQSKKLFSELKREAADSGFNNITTLHVLKHGLVELDDYITNLDNGKIDYDVDKLPPLAEILAEECREDMFAQEDLRKMIKPVIKKNLTSIDSYLKKEKKVFVNSSLINPSEDLIDGIWQARTPENPIDPYIIYSGAINAPDDVTNNFVDDIINNINRKIMHNDKSLKERAPFVDYEDKARNILKNLSLGTNMFITYDNSKQSVQNFLDTIYKVHEKSNEKTNFIELNSNTRIEYLNQLVNKLSKDKKQTHIIALNPSTMIILDSVNNLGSPEDGFALPVDLVNILNNQPSNIKFLFHDTKNNYYAVAGNSGIASIYKSFEEISIPALSTAQMINAFHDNPVMMKDVQKPFSKKALEKTVEASAQLDGAFPYKTLNLMKKIASYYVDKKEIKEADVNNYMQEASWLTKKNNDDSSFEVVFDTGRKLKDMVGKTSTKKEAATIVKQIKSNNLGTKGLIVYSEDGSAGSGRRYTAKAIAGEAGVPYMEMNTMDFGTKDVDIFGGGAVLSPEASVKKLFSLVKTQAEANKNKSAVLFIENFEYFSVGELVSLYHQKAMAQLLREMDKADKAGLNILVVGSVADPRLIGQATMKSFKFVDSIEVSSPAYNDGERAEIIEHALKQNKIRLDAASDNEKADIISYAATITRGFSLIYLKNFIKKAQNVALERGNKKITKGDLTEAYLQLTTGRPAVNKIEDHDKRIVTSHECGHATNLEVMNNIAKTLGKPWHIPDKVNFITLDPRGMYGGAVYHGKDKNEEFSFETMFANIVCSFGGNSAESLFYGMEGSYGISCDMESVRDCAEIMVKVMGLGAKTGKMAIDKSDDLSDKMKSIIEDDERVIINNAKISSDLITEVYADFNNWFTQKYAPLVGTGDCIMHGDEFRVALNKWKSEQSEEKQKELQLCDATVQRIMEATKKGIAVRKE